MRATHPIRNTLVPLLGLLWFSCLPLRDLDSAASGTATGGTTSGGVTGAAGASGGTGLDGAGAGGARDAAAPPLDAPTGGAAGDLGSGGAVEDGGAGAETGGGGSSGGATGLGGTIVGAGGQVSPQGGSGGWGGSTSTGGATSAPAPDLPDITDSPAQGEIIHSAGASWDIDGEQWPAFEIHTPTASYWLVKSAAAIVSITDSSQTQWINFSSGFRPNRGVPNLGGCCQPGNPSKLGLPTMTTEVDSSFTLTSTHLRLVSKSEDVSYWLVWDFFLTHFTLTVNRAAKPFGFTYRGLPGGVLSPSDQLVLAGGAARSASNPYNTVIPGPAAWAYIAHPAVNQSLFLIQHSEDALSDTYRIADGDTAMFTFGGGEITQTPVRFSLGLIGSCADEDVTNRIAFVRNAIH